MSLCSNQLQKYLHQKTDILQSMKNKNALSRDQTDHVPFARVPNFSWFQSHLLQRPENSTTTHIEHPFQFQWPWFYHHFMQLQFEGRLTYQAVIQQYQLQIDSMWMDGGLSHCHTQKTCYRLATPLVGSFVTLHHNQLLNESHENSMMIVGHFTSIIDSDGKHFQIKYHMGLKLQERDSQNEYEETVQLHTRREEDQDNSYHLSLCSDRSFHNIQSLPEMAQAYGINPNIITSYRAISTRFSKPVVNYLDIRMAQSQNWSEEQTKQGLQFARQGAQEKAIRCYDSALQHDPKNVDAIVARGCAYANKKRFQIAISDFQLALTYDPQCTNAEKYLLATKRKVDSTKGIADVHRLYQTATSQQQIQQQKQTASAKKAKTRTSMPSLRPHLEMDLLGGSSASSSSSYVDLSTCSATCKKKRSRPDEEPAQSLSKSRKKRKKKDTKKRKDTKKKKKKKKSKQESSLSSPNSSCSSGGHPILDRKIHHLWG